VPDAPAPRFNSLGDLVGSWQVHLGYDEAADVLYLQWQTPGSRWTKSRHHRESFPPSDIEDVLAKVQVLARTLGARRLF
jgi:hypothetical protein